MSLKELLLIPLIGISLLSLGQTYYVAPGGALSLSTDESSPGDIEFAFSNASIGSTVYIKQGNYGALNLVVGSDSVSFIGYTSTPGDISSTEIPDYDSYDVPTLEAIFPLIDGGDQATGGTAINASKNAVTIENFYVRNYNNGYNLSGSGNVVRNCVGVDFGDKFNSYNGTGYTYYGNANTFENCFLLNSGAQGITVKGNDNVIRNCQVYCDDTIAFAPTDYYILVTANSSTSEARNNLVEDCSIERIYNVGHTGHGYCLTTFYIHQSCSSGGGYCYNSIYKDDSVVNNIVRNSVSKNIGELVLLRGPGVRGNDLINLTSENFGGLSITTGASFNTFTGMHVKSSHFWDNPSSSSISFNAGIEFFASGWGDTTDMNVPYSAQGTYPWEHEVCAEGNVFRNCLFENVSAAIMNSSYGESYDEDGNPVDRVDRKIVKDNKFVNCTFVGREDSVDVFCYAMRGSEGNEFINCAIYGFNHWESRYFPESGSASVIEAHGIIPANYTFNHCNFYANTFDGLLMEDGIISGPTSLVTAGFNDSISGEFINCNFDDPGFLDVSAYDFHIEDLIGSGTKDRGLTMPEMSSLGLGDLTFDFDQAFRPCNDVYDIGAYEFQDCSITGLDQAEAAYQVYPNPSDGIVFLQLREGQAVESVELYDLVGRRILKIDQPASFMEIDLPKTRGVYLIMVKESTGKVLSKKVIRR